MRIFIGSSSEQLYSKNKDEIKKLSEEEKQEIVKHSKPEEIAILLDKDYEVVKWWDPNVMEVGKHFMESLIKISNYCDGAIIFFGNDDQIVNTKDGVTEAEKYVSRDNVYIEYGMFVSKKGTNRTMAILGKDVTWPSDISGISYPKMEDPNLSKKVLDFFCNAKKRESSYEKITLYVNKDTTNNIIEGKYKEWKSRSLYIGLESARKWRNIEDSHSYFGREGIATTKGIFLSTKSNELFSPPLENVISLGAGVGIIDLDLMGTIEKQNSNNVLNYIPLDISLYLAFMASNELSSTYNVPFSIIDDFEKESFGIGGLIDEKLNIKKQKNLYLMLGGTFANLEGKEDRFFNNIKCWMSDNDYFLLDVFIKNEKYDDVLDERTDIKSLPQVYKDFIINAVQTKFGNMNDKEVNKVLSKIEDYVICDPIKKEDIPDNTDIKEKNIPTHIAKDKGLPTILRYKYKGEVLFIAKRYDFDTLKEYLSEHFYVVDEMKNFKNQKIVGRGVLLMRLMTKDERRNKK